MAKIHVIRTGLVQVRQAQASSKGHGIARTVNMLIDSEWTDWLPIYAWQSNIEAALCWWIPVRPRACMSWAIIPVGIRFTVAPFASRLHRRTSWGRSCVRQVFKQGMLAM